MRAEGPGHAAGARGTGPEAAGPGPQGPSGPYAAAESNL
jgi:hypothetical protein